MADQKISELDTLSPVDNADYVAVVDVSSGVTKKATRAEFKGDQGDPGDDGRSLIWEGAWLTATAYQVDDVVSQGGSSYICIVAHTSGTFATDLAAAKWQLMAQKGDTGATGPTGPQGPEGDPSEGDMDSSVYDPQGIEDDAFDVDNHTDGATNKVFTAGEKTKLAGIEALADVTDAGNVGSSIHGAAAKVTPVDADTVPLIDSAASNVLKKVTWANVKATLKTYFDTLYAAALGSDDNYVTDAEKIAIGTISAKANDADVVHDTGDETVAGIKTFSSDPIIPDEAYGSGWNGSLEPPTKNAVYDKVESIYGAVLSTGGYHITTGFGATKYGDSSAEDGASTTEANTGNLIPLAGTLKNLYIKLETNTLNSGTIVFTIMINGVATAVTVSANFGETGIIFDITHSVAVAAGDRVSVRSVAGGTSGGVNWTFSYLIK